MLWSRAAGACTNRLPKVVQNGYACLNRPAVWGLLGGHIWCLTPSVVQGTSFECSTTSAEAAQDIQLRHWPTQYCLPASLA